MSAAAHADDSGPAPTTAGPAAEPAAGGLHFDTLLIANRGEIAVRVIRTARRMGLRTVAVFSDPDRGAPHVRLADAAVRLGPAPARSSYLDVAAVLAAARETGAGAVHPGYGFLSENADFARSCEAQGLAFVGPTPAQLELFGAKHTARAAAETAGVPLLPGTGLLPDLGAALAAAAELGYPVMLKATGGGGGIGMRACRSAAELADAWESVQRVAAAGFSSAGIFLERLVERARHVEVQVFGDGHGHVRTLGDRDCSLQRRHQKVVEEAPAPALPDQVRRQLAESARALCASVEMLIGPADCDNRIAEVAALLQPPLRIAVVGAHLTGQPLNHQLRALGAHLAATTRTAPAYRLFALDTEPRKPGLVRVTEGGAAIEAELWELSPAALGHFTAALPRPMTLGNVELADGTAAPGFLCEPQALATARDITPHGSWRAYLATTL